MSKRISVCLATHNGQKFIVEQIDTILNQIGKHDELIISDDNSSDNTVSIILSYNDSRIKLFCNQFNNLVDNFEFMLKICVGEYIFLADQDDVWMPDKISIMSDYLNFYDIIVSNSIVVDSEKNELFTFFNRSIKKMNKESMLLKILRPQALGCCMGFNRKVLKFALPFPKNTFMHDWWLWAIANMYGKTQYIEDELVLYRRHGNNYTCKDGVDPVIDKVDHIGFISRSRIRLRLLMNLLKHKMFNSLKRNDFQLNP